MPVHHEATMAPLRVANKRNSQCNNKAKLTISTTPTILEQSRHVLSPVKNLIGDIVQLVQLPQNETAIISEGSEGLAVVVQRLLPLLAPSSTEFLEPLEQD